MDLFLPMGRPQQLQEITLELAAVVRNVFAGVLADEQHLADVGFGLSVHFETIFVAALLFADLAVPAQALEAFGFEFIVEIFGAADFCFGHFDGGGENGLMIPVKLSRWLMSRWAEPRLGLGCGRGILEYLRLPTSVSELTLCSDFTRLWIGRVVKSTHNGTLKRFIMV